MGTARWGQLDGDRLLRPSGRLDSGLTQVLTLGRRVQTREFRTEMLRLRCSGIVSWDRELGCRGPVIAERAALPRCGRAIPSEVPRPSGARRTARAYHCGPITAGLSWPANDCGAFIAGLKILRGQIVAASATRGVSGNGSSPHRLLSRSSIESKSKTLEQSARRRAAGLPNVRFGLGSGTIILDPKN